MAHAESSHEHHSLHREHADGRTGDGQTGDGETSAAMDMASAEIREKATDAVCGITVNPATLKHRFDHAGRTFYFCCANCREKFAADPSGCLVPAAKTEPPKADGAIYPCPMHPEVRREGPGSCPLCGMALERLVVNAEAPPNHELTDMTRRFWFRLVLSAPVVAREMGGHVPWLGLHHIVPPALSAWIQFTFASPVASSGPDCRSSSAPGPRS